MAKSTKLLCILDGFGLGNASEYNAIYKAHTPNWDRLIATYPMSKLDASGDAVGLPNAQMGNSEVGHLNIGAGRIVKQLLPLINDTIAAGELGNQEVLQQFIKQTKAANNVCHLLGLISNGGVHGDIQHVIALAKILAISGIKVNIHAILDGRDTAPQSGAEFLKTLQAAIKDNSNISIVTLAGRYYTMDRDNNWERVEKSYSAMITADAKKITDIDQYILASYQANITDEFIVPVVTTEFSGIKDNDSIIFTNFRADRARQIAKALFIDDFSGFARKVKINFAAKLSMAEYSKELDAVLPCLFPVTMPKNTLSDILAEQNMRQLHMAETEKYAHVTFFFNGGVEVPKKGEERVLIKSPNVATFDLKPEMSAPELTDKLVTAINSREYDFIVVNYANADMVGHTGNMAAAIKAVEALDEAIGKVEAAIRQVDGEMIITADHGNIEYMYDDKAQQKHTSHTLNFVPFLLVSKHNYNLSDGRLCDIAPTILELMNLHQPAEMTGKSLISEY